MPRTPLYLAMLVCCLLLWSAAPAVAGPTPFEKRLVAKINQVRGAHGLGKLRLRAGLNRAAHRWSRYLLRSNSFYHGRIAAGVSENLAWATCNRAGAGRIVRMWMASSGHRAAILRRGIRRIGPGATRGNWRGNSCVRMAVVRFR